MDDLLRKRIYDVVSKPRSADVAVGEWLDPEVGSPYELAHRHLNGRTRYDGSSDDTIEPMRQGYETPRAQFRTTGHSRLKEGPLAELLHQIDLRDAGDAAIAPSTHRWNAAPDGLVHEWTRMESSEQEQLSTFVSDHWNARLNYERDQHGESVGRSAISALERASLTFPLEYGIGAAAGERPSRFTIEHPTRTDLAATTSIGQTELSNRASCTSRSVDDQRDWMRRRIENDRRASEPLNSIGRQLDALAREVNERETDATDDEITEFKHRLTTLAREAEIQAERKLLDGDDGACGQSASMPSALVQYRPVESTLEGQNPFEQLDLRARRHDAWSEVVDIRPWSGSADLPAGQCPTEAFESELSTILNSSLLQRQPPSAVQSFDGGRREPGEPLSLNEDALAVVSDRWGARPGEEREQPEAAASRPTISAVDRDRMSASRARRNGANKRRPRSAVAPIVRAGLATVLAIAVVVTATYFARSRISGAFVSKPVVTIAHEGAPAGQIAAAGPVTITPQPTVARFQDLVFPLPHLYGIYVINSGRLFELEALPGQAPDPRVAVSAAIRRTSHTVLSDGRVAFLLFRRDMATNISERVSVRVVAKIHRSVTDPGDEPRSAGQGSEWAIRNIAVDFRVAPVDHNKEMVLLLPEKSDFAFPSGRYALILKGQAYDFTVGGPITDPTQCLERVEAANGNFFHECQQPQAGTAGSSLQDALPSHPRSLSKKVRQSEVHARR